MSYCSAGHEIQLINITNNSNTAAPLLLIKGKIKNPQCRYINKTNNINNTTTNTNIANLKIVNKTINLFCNNICLSKSKNTFKCIIPLVMGINLISIQFCNYHEELKISFENQTEKLVKLYYIICKEDPANGSYQSPFLDNTVENACAKINVATQLVQCILAEKLYEQNLGRKCFQSYGNCEPFYSQLSVEAAHLMNQNELWMYFAKEILAASENNCQQTLNTKFIGFLSCTSFMGIGGGDGDGGGGDIDNNEQVSYFDIRTKLKGSAALGRGDFVLFGTGCLYTWPTELSQVMSCFQNTNKINLTKYLDDSNHRRTFGGCFATTLGSLCHEIGHIFDLGHTATGIMGNGFDYVNRIFTIDNLTDDLPERIVISRAAALTSSSLPQSQNERKFTNIRKSNNFLVKYHEQRNDNDLTYFLKSSAVILAKHKWFNNDIAQSKEISKENPITFRIDLIKSKNEISVIELREPEPSALMVHSYIFDNEKCFEFKIPMELLKGNDIFVIDELGNVKIFFWNEI